MCDAAVGCVRRFYKNPGGRNVFELVGSPGYATDTVCGVPLWKTHALLPLRIETDTERYGSLTWNIGRYVGVYRVTRLLTGRHAWGSLVGSQSATKTLALARNQIKRGALRDSYLALVLLSYMV